jgi:hypothetical protein
MAEILAPLDLPVEACFACERIRAVSGGRAGAEQRAQ